MVITSDASCTSSGWCTRGSGEDPLVLEGGGLSAISDIVQAGLDAAMPPETQTTPTPSGSHHGHCAPGTSPSVDGGEDGGDGSTAGESNGIMESDSTGAVSEATDEWDSWSEAYGDGDGDGNGGEAGWGISLLKIAADFSAGAGDCLTGRCLGLSTSLTEMARNTTFIDSDSAVTKSSSSYAGGEIFGGAVGVSLAGASAARAAGWTSRIAVHSAHHAFELLGGAELAHVQLNIWQIGVKGSGFTVFRIPLPWW
jgi:hypothetical protein